MKITKTRLSKIIKEERQKLLKEYEQYVDEDGNIWDDEGNVTRRGAAFGRQYGGGTYGTNAPWSGGRSRSSYSSKRKTSYVGADANADQIAAVEKAIASKPNNFLSSVLTQLQKGRGLSSKQKSIVKKILSKTSPEDATLFEGKRSTMKITKRQLRRIIKEEKAKLIAENLEDRLTLNLKLSPSGNDLELYVNESDITYDLSEYLDPTKQKGELYGLMRDFEADHGDRPHGVMVIDYDGIGMGDLPIEQAWEWVAAEYANM